MGKHKDRVTASKANSTAGARGLLSRLRSDIAGNTLALVGAGLVPLAGMIGSGVDLSRAYMAKTRLQSACDAASLAARRVLTNDTMTDAVRAEGNKFFNFNFPQRLYETAAFTPDITRPEAGVVRITAQTTIPTVVMKMFGFNNLPLQVSCEASQNFVNTDIVLVLDVTRSMICLPGESSMCSRSTEDSNSRIVGLRSAVMALYDELAPVQQELERAGMRLRYGIVPFSSSVNVGKLLTAVDDDYVADSWTYQSRTAFYDNSSSVVRTNKTLTQCNAYNVPRSPATGFPATETTTARQSGSPNQGRDCTVTTHNYNQTGQGTLMWLHEPRVLDTSAYKESDPQHRVDIPTRAPSTSGRTDWAGCIEERDTVSTITSASNFNIPAGAWDLNINHVPNSEETKWRPFWPEVIYDRDSEATATYNNSNSDSQRVSSNTIFTACPTQARRLDAMTRDQMQTYVNGLQVNGPTYHDIGMIWGARLISAGGVFHDSPDEFNGMSVSKHIIFMTDGAIQPYNVAYSSYGYEKLDERISGAYNTADSTLLGIHRQRFRMLCNAVKSMNVSVWVVAFATTPDTSMSECASSPTQFAAAGTSQQLIDKFEEIGKNIGALRLTQ